MLGRFIKWWKRPSARERILAALSLTEWRRGYDIIKTARVEVGQFYVIATSLEEVGALESKWDDGPTDVVRGARPNKMFRLTVGGRGKRHASKRTLNALQMKHMEA